MSECANVFFGIFKDTVDIFILGIGVKKFYKNLVDKIFPTGQINLLLQQNFIHQEYFVGS